MSTAKDLSKGLPGLIEKAKEGLIKNHFTSWHDYITGFEDGWKAHERRAKEQEEEQEEKQRREE